MLGNAGDFFLPAPSRFEFPTSSFHVPLEMRSIMFLTKYDLTNKEVSTVLCSVVKHAGSG